MAFVKYIVALDQKVETPTGPSWVRHRASGVVRDTPEKLGKIFQQNAFLKGCTQIAYERYIPLR